MRFRSLLSGVLVALLARPAFAQSTTEWTDPIITILESLTSGFGVIGGLIVGVGIMALGAWAAMTGRMEWHRMIYVILGGILIMVGPSVMSQLLGAE